MLLQGGRNDEIVGEFLQRRSDDSERFMVEQLAIDRGRNLAPLLEEIPCERNELHNICCEPESSQRIKHIGTVRYSASSTDSDDN